MQPTRPMGPRRPPGRRPVRRQPAYIYRRRRVVAGIALVLFLFLASRVIGSCGDDGGGVDAGDTTSTTAATTTTTLPKPPACAVADTPVAGNPTQRWQTALIDTAYRLPDDYVPPDLVDAEAAGFPTGFKIREIVIEKLGALREAAAANGTPIGLIATFRTYEQQADLYARRERELGAEVARTRAARAGHSEHQLGVGVDFGSEGDIDVTQEWGTSPTGKWLAAHAHEYGFIMSYPEGKAALTCYDYEPWHFRYVGPKRAAAIKASGLTLREYLWAQQQGALPS